MIFKNCPICNNEYRVFVPEARVFRQCVCWPEMIATAARDMSGIRRDYLDSTFAEFEPRQEYPNQQEALDVSQAYANDWLRVREEGRGLSILGAKSSMGKSHLAVSICLQLIDQHWTRSTIEQDVCLFVNVMNWFADWRRLMDDFPSLPKDSVMWESRMLDSEYTNRSRALAMHEKRMFSTELLVLDDISRFNPNPSRLERLYNIIDKRTGNRQPIIITDNASTWEQISAKLGSDFGPPIVDRLSRSSDVILIKEPMAKKRRKK